MKRFEVGLAMLVGALAFTGCQKSTPGEGDAAAAAPSAETPKTESDKSGAAPQEQDPAGAPSPGDTTGSIAPGKASRSPSEQTTD
jgi:hypothetical protein